MVSIVDRVKSVDKKQLFFLFLIFLIGFGFRADLMKFELFFEFDSYWHARMAEQVINTGMPFTLDPMSYYQLGGGPMSYTGVGWWYLTAVIYKIFSLPITGGAYDKLLWIGFVKFLPAFFGALTGIAMFFFFREMYGKRAGYLAGFFTAVSSGYIYRTMAGFFEGGSVLFLFMVIGFYFLAKAMKKLEFNKKTIIDSTFGGFFLGVTAWFGGWYLIIPYVLLPFGFVNALVLWFRNQNAMNFVKLFAVMIVVFAAINFVQPAHPGFEWLNATFSYFRPYIGLSDNPVPDASTSEGDIGAVFRSSVGEQQSGLPSFGQKFNALVIFPVIAIPLLLWRIVRKKEDTMSLLLFFWIGITFVMAIVRLQMTFAFGLALAAGTAFIFSEILEFAQKMVSFEKKILCAGLLLFVFIGVASAALFMTTNTPNIESETGWKDALKFISTQTPKDAKMFNWWDEGHWISFIGERKVLLDNRNIDLNGDSYVALAIVTDDANLSCSIMKKYGSDYAVFGSDLLEKEASLSYYGYKSLSSSNPNLRSFIGSSAAVLDCEKQVDNFVCSSSYGGQLTLNEQQMLSIPTDWTSNPIQFADERTPIFIYRSSDNKALYYISGARINNSFLARAWFNDKSVDCLERVYGETVKVFKIK